MRERALKWVRRHPRLASASTIAAISIAVVVLLASGLAYRGIRLARLEAGDNLAQFQADMRKAQVQLLDAPTAGRTIVEEAADNCRQALNHYGVVEQEDWQEGPQFQNLPTAEQRQTREDVGELLFLAAAIEGLKRDSTARGTANETSSQGDHLLQAIDLNRRAEKCYPADSVPGGVWRQRRRVLPSDKGKAAEAKELIAKADARPPKSARDFAMAACELMSQRRFQAALPLWQHASALDSQNIWAWYGLGHCYDQLSQPTQAVSCYTGCCHPLPSAQGFMAGISIAA